MGQAALEAILDELLVAWRETRAPALADAVDRVSDGLLPTEEPIASGPR